MEHSNGEGLWAAVLDSAAEFAQRPAIITEHQTLSYRQLAGTARALAAGLEEIGVQRGDRIALLLPNSPQFVISYLSVIALGGLVVPLHCQLSVEEAGYILDNAEAKGLISLAQFAPMVAQLWQQVPSLSTVILEGESKLKDAVGLEQLISDYTDQPLHSDMAKRDDPAAIIYTSGTTGRPKGAVLSHGNLLANARSCLDFIGVTSEDRFLAVLPLFHSFGATICMILPLIAGAGIVLQTSFAPLQVLEAIANHRVTIFPGVPSMFVVLVRGKTDQEYDLSSLRLCISGGAPLPTEVLTSFRERYDVPLVEGYGPTEASPVVSVNPPDGLQKPGSVGVPIPGVQVRITDAAGNELPSGEVGEITVAGDNVMLGYWNNLEATAATVRDGWLYTGDLGKLDGDGYLYVVGRKKDLIIVGGTNVYPREVEVVIAQMPQVSEVAVVGVPDALRGERIKAVVVLTEEAQLTYEQLLTYCRQHLAAFKVPHMVEFRDSLPKSHLGKVLKRKLHGKTTTLEVN